MLRRGALLDLVVPSKHRSKQVGGRTLICQQDVLAAQLPHRVRPISVVLAATHPGRVAVAIVSGSTLALRHPCRLHGAGKLGEDLGLVCRGDVDASAGCRASACAAALDLRASLGATVLVGVLHSKALAQERRRCPGRHGPADVEAGDGVEVSGFLRSSACCGRLRGAPAS